MINNALNLWYFIRRFEVFKMNLTLLEEIGRDLESRFNRAECGFFDHLKNNLINRWPKCVDVRMVLYDDIFSREYHAGPNPRKEFSSYVNLSLYIYIYVRNICIYRDFPHSREETSISIASCLRNAGNFVRVSTCVSVS